jgi:hypothetical protein
MRVAAQIVDRIAPPTPKQIRRARVASGLTQTQAAQCVSAAATKAYRSWQGYEVDVGQKDHRKIPLALWELFLLMTDQHPSLRLQKRVRTATKEA